jgi:hypothetical protein
MTSEIKVTVTSTVSPPVDPHIDDEVIAAWIEARLNDGRNRFITSMGAGPGHSAPGAYPNQQSGTLAGSIDFQMTGAREGELFSDLNYAAYLTDGTTKMDPRKMLWDAFQEVMNERPETDELAQAVVIVGATHYA